ncbi:MAG TPA: glycosyltransferase [Propionibacteriaceae bacterium]|nr:glycosyltransferase [Propionibacteriaceae bacterium]
MAVPLRVGLVCGYLDPTRDGVAHYASRLAAQLSEGGLEPVLLTTAEWADQSSGRAVGVTRRWSVFGVLTAAARLRRLHLDLIHVQFAPSVFRFSRAIGLLPLLLPRRIPLIVTLHEYGVWGAGRRGGPLFSRLWSAVERRGWADRETLLLVPRADRVLICSSEHRDVLVQRFGSRVPAALEVPIGLNVAIGSGDPSRVRESARRQLGADPSAPLVAFFGFLHPEKSLDRLIDAVAALRDSWPDVHLVLIGGVESHSVSEAAAGALLNSLHQSAAAAGMTGRVHITGYLPDAEVSRLLRAVDVVALPLNAGVTRKSGSLLATFAAGVPVVATAAPGQLTEPTQIDGVLRVPPGNTAALTDALGRVLSEPALADRLRRAADTVVAHHSWDVIAATHAQVYDRAASDRARDKRGEPWQSGPRSTRKVMFMSLLERARSAVEKSVAAVRERAPANAANNRGRPTEDPALHKPLIYGDPTRLHIAPTAIVNNALFNLSSGDITVGDYAFFGHSVSVLTGTHDWTKFGAERQVAVPQSGRDVVIEEGAWVSSNAIIVAPCRIGAHSVVGVGSLVLKDVEPYTIVAGSPAKVLRTIPRPEEPGKAKVDPEPGAGAVAAG